MFGNYFLCWHEHPARGLDGEQPQAVGGHNPEFYVNLVINSAQWGGVGWVEKCCPLLITATRKIWELNY